MIVFDDRLSLPAQTSNSVRYGVLFGGFGIILLYLIIILIVSLRVDERKLVIGHAICLVC